MKSPLRNRINKHVRRYNRLNKRLEWKDASLTKRYKDYKEIMKIIHSLSHNAVEGITTYKYDGFEHSISNIKIIINNNFANI